MFGYGISNSLFIVFGTCCLDINISKLFYSHFFLHNIISVEESYVSAL